MKKKETETMDIYKDEQRDEMLKSDEITVAKNTLMAEREIIIEKNRDLWLEAKEMKTVELAQKEHQED